MRRPWLATVCTATAIGTLLRAQELPGASRPDATVQASANWSWQCDPIRFTVQVTGTRGATMVRPKRADSEDALFPLVVERRVGDTFEPVCIALAGRRAHPARQLTPPGGLRIEDAAGRALEVELWHLAAVATPGRIRVRVQLEVRDARSIVAKWTDLPTPWCEIDIRPHAGNAAHLLRDDAAAERAASEALQCALNTTWATSRHAGPVNIGPSRPSLRPWQAHAPTAERLVADENLSFRLRARARLVLAYEALEQAMRSDGETRETALRAASAHLAAKELVASAPSGGLEALPSGGFEPLRLMLLACIEGMRGGTETRTVHRELCARYPFFAMWWRDEAAEMMLR